MSLGRVLLGVLVDGPAHGYDLKRAHDERFPAARPLAFGQVYATLARLERDGLVEVAGTEQAGGPERTTYAVTEAGRAALADWLREPETPGPYAADALVRKTVTALHAGGDALAFLDRQRAVHLDAMRSLTRARRDGEGPPDVATRIALDHTIAHLDADLRWLEETRERIGR
ncbi:PadR family transcriptional regulator [Nocardioides perillae]|uniref:DNA-binding PadR family transcriptional regulator n=1 Tax=Nocardioides perillae TaxID=1119534 RepID=A0A7Y9RSU1_9ACTN|nr:PadR family transcriptional regulator [Nocardioides perillae]NYG54258.1 DNA-binding PadR family transcriptional regulator [Nocardioides perillae]